MAGRKSIPPKALTFAQTPGITDPALQRAFDVVTRAIQDLQARRHLELFTSVEVGYVPASGGSTTEFLSADGTWKSIVGSGAVDSVTAGSTMVTASPTTGAVVVDVVPANFTGIPESGVSGLVADLAARPTGAPAANSGLSARWVTTTALGDGAFIDDGTNATSLGYLRVTGDFSVATSKFTVAASTGNTLVAGTLNVTGAGTFSSTLDATGNFAVNTNKFTVAASTGNTLVAGTLTISPMTSGSVLFAGAAGLVSQNNASFYWDNTNIKLGVGTNSFSDNTVYGGATVSGIELSKSSTAYILATSQSASASDSGGFFGVKNRGTRASPSAVLSGDLLSVFGGSGYQDTSTNHYCRAAQMVVQADGNFSASSAPGAIVFQTVPAASTTMATRATLFSTGNLNIGSTTADPAVKLRVEGATTLGTTSTTDVTTITGRLALTSAFTNVSAVTVNLTPSASSANLVAAGVFTNNGTYNTASAGLGEIGVAGIVSATKSGGANNLTNIAGYFTSTNGDVNVAVYTLAGSNYLNATNGNTGIGYALGASLAQKFNVSGTSLLDGQVDVNSHKIVNLTNGSSAQDAAAFGQIATAVNAAVSGTANQTAKFTGTNVVGNGWATDDGTTWGVASKFTITEANGNFRTFGTSTLDGNATVGAAVSNVHTINGNVVLNDDGISSGSFRVVNTPALATAAPGIVVVQQGTFDTTAAGRFSQGIQAIVSSTVGAGANSLTNRGVYTSVTGGTTNYAFFSDFGDNRFNAAGGSTLFSRDVAINGNATIGDGAGDAHTVNGTITFNHAVTMASTLAVNGNATIGDAAGDSHTINGLLTCANDFAVNGNTTLGDAATDTCSVNADYVQFAALGASGDTYVYRHSLNFDYATNSATAGIINNVGYQGGATQFRDLQIGDGKAGIAIYINASEKSVRFGSSTGPLVKSGSGSPESAITAPIGSLYLRTDGGAGTSMYVKESGTGNTGWVGK